MDRMEVIGPIPTLTPPFWIPAFAGMTSPNTPANVSLCRRRRC